jgi:stage II sporulation protein M
MKRKIIQKKRFDIREEYKKSFNYLKESKNFIYISIGIFLFFALIGFFVPTPEPLYNQIVNFIKEILKETQGMSQIDLINFILANNIKSTFFAIFLGIIFGVFPIINAIANGYLLGFVSSISVSADGFLSLWKLMPHGIFELPAVFISLGLGLRLGTFIFQKKRLESFKNYLVNSLRIFLLIVVPLLIIAGIIEGSLIYFLSN